ncbi:CerR family C-terminal domain-containing protein [Amaricoccus sp.]|uniref:CerR family C-terminal domain-containing protein n=1 Tax=Amaricoccus sp. TaxID=1872485 RepID=UPI00261BD807|nr:CerR family C-terminal domain-containing protein [Amaricoccus sp.]HRO13065.1 CerR family C-terminal domain-containing protein [Amaricoccus sp.]
MTAESRPVPTVRSTREVIIEAALRGFGEKGFAATSVREIAAAAGTNIASISYHFGGKEGLRDACAEHIVRLMGDALAAARPGEPLPPDPLAAAETLAGLVRSLVRFLLLEPQGPLVAGFMLREMAHPSSALDTIYEGLFDGVHRTACAVWATATGRPAESEAVRLAVFAVIGQILYFRIAAPVVERRMGWPGIGPAEAEAIAGTVLRNLTLRLDADRRDVP